LVVPIAFTPEEEDELAAVKEDCIPLVIAEVDDFTRVVNACFLVDSDFFVLDDVESLNFITLVFVLLLVPLEVATSFFVTVILITCLSNYHYVTFGY